MRKWLQGLTRSQAMEPEVPAPIAEEVPTLSPARLLAESLTDPDTRGEWVREEPDTSPLGMGSTVSYRNEARDITVSRTWWTSGLSGGERIRTPFSLSTAEEAVVRRATYAFDQRLRAKAEADALNRLTAPTRAQQWLEQVPAKLREEGDV